MPIKKLLNYSKYIYFNAFQYQNDTVQYDIRMDVKRSVPYGTDL